MPELLVSVRSAAEARAALAAGAGLVDVKEPSRGALGRADATVIAQVVEVVRGRRPVSAALGELAEACDPPPPGLAYVKWGLAGWSGSGWRQRLRKARQWLRSTCPETQPVAVGYADWPQAQAPSLEEVCDFACEQGWPACLIDTWKKDGRNLLTWLDRKAVERLCASCQAEGVRVALAGSLSAADLPLLAGAAPDWFAVRGAACRGGQRAAAVDRQRVRALVNLLQRPGRRHSRTGIPVP